MTSITDIDRSYWEDIFPFDPYEKQVKGIEEAVQTLRSNGVYLLEGACGTGKTLIALSAGLAALRDDNTDYRRLLVVTSKKQQLRAFEDDLAEINKGPVDFNGLTLVGKADVCPYVQTGKISKQDIYHQCVNLRDNTNGIMSELSNENKVERKADAGVGLAKRISIGNNPEKEPMEVAGVDAPYPVDLPSFEGTEYCPFFAQYFVNDYTNNQPIKVSHGTTARDTLRNGVKEGTCPHAAMKRMVDDGDVLIGNYKHAFSPRTVENFSGKLFTDETILIIDEAHEVVGQVRDELSYSVTMRDFRYAIRDVDMVLSWLRGEGRHAKVSLARQIVDGNDDLTADDIAGLKKFLIKVYDILSDRTEKFLESEFGSGWGQMDPESASIESCPLQNGDTDILESWLDEYAGRDDWMQALQLGYNVAYIRTAISKKVDGKTPEGDFAIERVRELFYRWLVGGHVEFYRELLLTPIDDPNSGTSDAIPSAPWDGLYDARIRLNNCIPMDEIAGTLDSFGASIVMSATLEPIDIYSEVTGINQLEQGYQPHSTLVTKAADRLKKMRGIIETREGEEPHMPDDMDDLPDPSERKRYVKKSTFEMDFPPENRKSIAVEAPKFTYSNRWPPEENRDLRETYEYIITSVAQTTPGNVIVFMPSYQEAAWAGDLLADDPSVSKPVLTDESSSDYATEQIKDEFFRGDGKILCTGLRGTLVEGVNFDGDKLHAAVICGVPIENTGTELASAINDAYSDRFGDWLGFQYAFTVPAVRKTRQALGRVIRGTEDVGVRVLADKRYTPAGGNASVMQYFPEYSQNDFLSVKPYELDTELSEFWDR